MVSSRTTVLASQRRSRLMFLRRVARTLVLTMACGGHAGAQVQDEPRFERVLSTDSFLTGAMIQDRDGLLWIGSQGSGLFRFDGIDVLTYNAGPDSLSDDNVLSLCEDQQGIIWIGTARGLTSYNKEIDTFSIYLHDPDDPNSISSNAFNIGLQTIIEDHQGNVWIGTRAGLNRFNRKTGAFQKHIHDPKDTGSLMDDDVVAIYEDNEGFLWIGTASGLARFDQERQRFVSYENPPPGEKTQSPAMITAILEDRDGVLWIGSDHGLSYIDRQSERCVRYEIKAQERGSLPITYVYTIHEDVQGRLWLAHNMKGGGLTVLDPAHDTFTKYMPTVGLHHQPSSDSIAGIFTDRSGITWVVNVNGSLDNWDDRAHRIKSYLHDPDDSFSISDHMINTAYEDSRGTIWFAAPNGLNRFDRESERFTRYPHDPSDPTAIPGGFVCGPFEDSEGNFWVLSDKYLSLFDRDRGICTNSFETFHSPISVLEDNTDSNVLWLCSWGEGLARFDKTTSRFLFFRHNPADKESLSNDLLVTMHQARDGLIWVPTMGGGLDIFDPRTKRVVQHYAHNPDDPSSLGSDTLTHVFVDSKGETWIASYGGGLHRFDPETESFERFDEKNGFPTNTITNILEDDAGNLWLGSKIGYVRFDPATSSARVYTVADGLAGNQFQEAALCKSQDGIIWVATISGASSFNPEDLVDNDFIPPVVVTSIKQSGEELKLGMAFEKVHELVLDWQHNYFEFEFAALNYTRPQKNRYKYKLSGIDETWFDSGERRFGRYANIPDGSYNLRIIGSNNDGVWNLEGTSIQVTVVPPFWRTIWFRLLVVLAGLGSGLALVTSRVSRARRERKALEKDLEERSRNEAVLRESEARFRSLVSNVPGAIYRATFDHGRHLSFLSPAFEDITCVKPVELLGEQGRCLEELVHPDDREEVERSIEDALVEREPFEIEYRLLRRPASERWVLDRGRGEYGPDGQLLWLGGALFDITKRRSLELQLMHTQKIESIGRLAGGIAHDLNNLLTAVIGNADLLLMEAHEDSPLREGLNQIQMAGARAGRLTGQLLTFARRSVIDPQELDLNDLIINLDKMLRRLIGENIEFVILPQQDLWIVKADASQMEQVVTNLAVNARDAMPSGGRLVIQTRNASKGHKEPDGATLQEDHVMIDVCDSGSGMSEEEQQQAFEPFFTTKEQGKGTGLGLATCWGIIDQCGGRITVESSPGHGSTFRVYLPRAEGLLAAIPSALAEEPIVGGNETILLVEDEPMVRDFAARVLQGRGYRLLLAADGEAGLRMAELAKTPIDLVLTDVVMPRMGGKELIQELKNRGFSAAVLFMSGYAESEIATDGVLDSGIELIQKPFSAASLARRVRAVLDH